jgi:RsiW-degrading membrane proteinase PrsW (M82 family)
MTLLLSSIAPALFIMYLIYRHDLEKEPLKMLLKAFLGGILSVLITFILLYVLGIFTGEMPSAEVQPFYAAFFSAAIPEEFAKWIVFYWLIQRAKDFDQYFDGILYAIFISMGFALLENILYVMDGGMGVAINRAIFAVPGHMLFAVPMGYYLSLSKFESGKDASYHRILSLMVPIFLHGTYDFILMYAAAKSRFSPTLAVLLIPVFIIFNIWMWRAGLSRIKKHREKDRTIA